MIATGSPVIRRLIAVLSALCAPIAVLGLTVAPPSAMRTAAEEKCVGISSAGSDPRPFAPKKYGERAEHEHDSQMCVDQFRPGQPAR
jgi:hypothetical protein